MRKDRWMIALLVAALLSPLAPARAENASRWENDRYFLSLDRETLTFEIICRQNGASFLSALREADSSLNAQWRDFLCSSISIEYAEETANTPTRVGLLSEGVVWNIADASDGFDAAIDFAAQGISLRFCVRLTGDGLTMTIPADGIIETGENLLCGVYITPGFGATLRGEKQGYMLLPEAAGAIVEYSGGLPNASAPYLKSVYGDNIGVQEQTAERTDYPAPRAEQKILMPLYGMARTDDGLAALCLMESGQDNAQILCYAAGIVTQYNFVGARFTMRDKYFKLNSASRGAMVNEKDIQSRDLTVRVCLLSGNDANYNGMAARYRRYLIEERGLSLVEKSFSVRLDFLAAETERDAISNQTVTTTTVGDMREILLSLNESGVTAVDAAYTGWQNGGKTAGYGLKTGGIDGRLGDIGALYALSDEIAARGGTLSLTQELLYAWQGRGYARDTLARKINRQALNLYTNHQAYPTYGVLSPLYTLELARETAKIASGRLGVAVTGASSIIYSYAVSGDESHMRGDTLGQYAETFGFLSRESVLALSQPLAEYWPYADAFFDLPLETTNYSLISSGVPFLTMALDGLIPLYGEILNFDADPDYALLRMIEYGAKPSYLLTMAQSQELRKTNSENVFTSQWRDLLPGIVSAYRALDALWREIGQGVLISHEHTENGLIRLGYSSGVAVYLNYGKSEARAQEGVAVPARGYACVGGEAK